jgi:quinol monooxygenase YgiN
VIVVQRFRVPAEQGDRFRADAEEALAVLTAQRGCLTGHLGRNVDDPALWVLQTTWEGPGAYRRALSAYEVKMRAWQLLGQALDEPSAYELVRPGETLNEARPRGI